MAQNAIKKDVMVVVIRGAHRGKSGKVLRVDHDKDRVYVEGVNMGKKAQRRTGMNSQTGFVEKERPIHVSNVMAQERYQARQSKRTAASKQ